MMTGVPWYVRTCSQFFSQPNESPVAWFHGRWTAVHGGGRQALGHFAREEQEHLPFLPVDEAAKVVKSPRPKQDFLLPSCNLEACTEHTPPTMGGGKYIEVTTRLHLVRPHLAACFCLVVLLGLFFRLLLYVSTCHVVCRGPFSAAREPRQGGGRRNSFQQNCPSVEELCVVDGMTGDDRSGRTRCFAVLAVPARQPLA